MIKKQEQFKKLLSKINNGSEGVSNRIMNYGIEPVGLSRLTTSTFVRQYLTGRFVDISRGVFVPLDFSGDYIVRKRALIQQFSNLYPNFIF